MAPAMTGLGTIVDAAKPNVVLGHRLNAFTYFDEHQLSEIGIDPLNLHYGPPVIENILKAATDQDILAIRPLLKRIICQAARTEASAFMSLIPNLESALLVCSPSHRRMLGASSLNVRNGWRSKAFSYIGSSLTDDQDSQITRYHGTSDHLFLRSPMLRKIFGLNKNPSPDNPWDLLTCYVNQNDLFSIYAALLCYKHSMKLHEKSDGPSFIALNELTQYLNPSSYKLNNAPIIEPKDWNLTHKDVEDFLSAKAWTTWMPASFIKVTAFRRHFDVLRSLCMIHDDPTLALHWLIDLYKSFAVVPTPELPSLNDPLVYVRGRLSEGTRAIKVNCLGTTCSVGLHYPSISEHLLPNISASIPFSLHNLFQDDETVVFTEEAYNKGMVTSYTTFEFADDDKVRVSILHP